MSISQPTHVVTIGVWCPHSAESVSLQCWVTAGPFDSAADLAEDLRRDLELRCDAIEVIDRRISQHRPSTPPWEQLTLSLDG